jgi:Pyocin activator protein PrtN
MPSDDGKVNSVSSTYFGLLAEFGAAHIPLERVAPKYFGLSYEEARRGAPAKMLPCRAFRLGGRNRRGSSVRLISLS